MTGAVDFTDPLSLAVARWPELADLRYLDGWHWGTGPATLVGEMPLGGPWFNALVMYTPGDAYAARIRGLPDGGQDIVWLQEGPLATVLAALTKVPPPGTPGAPTDARPLTILPAEEITD